MKSVKDIATELAALQNAGEDARMGIHRMFAEAAEERNFTDDSLTRDGVGNQFLIDVAAERYGVDREKAAKKADLPKWRSACHTAVRGRIEEVISHAAELAAEHPGARRENMAISLMSKLKTTPTDTVAQAHGKVSKEIVEKAAAAERNKDDPDHMVKSVVKRLDGSKFKAIFTEESLQAAINAVKALEAKPIEEEKPSTVEASDEEVANALNSFGSLEDKLEAMLDAKLAAMLAAKSK